VQAGCNLEDFLPAFQHPNAMSAFATTVGVNVRPPPRLVGGSQHFSAEAPLDMRDGILQAVAARLTPRDRCTIWKAFAQFGIGVGANGVVNPGGTVTIAESFTKPGDCP